MLYFYSYTIITKTFNKYSVYGCFSQENRIESLDDYHNLIEDIVHSSIKKISKNKPQEYFEDATISFNALNPL